MKKKRGWIIGLLCVAAVVAETGYVQPEDLVRLLAFRDNPSDESWIGAGV